MKTFFALLALISCVSLPLHAQWITESYELKDGWNGIYLNGDASHATPEVLFADYPEVMEVWRWNPNPDQIQFSATPAQPDATSNEWTIWNREVPAEQMLSAMIGQSSYLIRCETEDDTITVTIPQKPQPPAATWLISGANFLGFPANANGTPTFTSYFASFPKATASPSKIYEYVGGELGPSNPVEITALETPLKRNTAYWFEVGTVGNFTGPVSYELPGNTGLNFGRTGNVITMGVNNLTSSEITLTLSSKSSEPAPTGQTGISGDVTLSQRIFDSESNSYVETPIIGEVEAKVAAYGRLDIQFVVDRTSMEAGDESLYASLIQIKDSASQSDVLIPVTAQPASPAGLWIGDVSVSTVESTVAESGNTTVRSFPLRVILHVDNEGTSRLLSQAYIGQLNVSGNPLGISIRETDLWNDTKADALRVVSSHMPLDRAIVGTGQFAVGSTLSHTVLIPFDDPTNPFVHQYHPDHDNRDARFEPLAAGVESYDITRDCSFTFTATPPDGSTITGWGSTIYGGTYSETIKGINKNDLTVGGEFTFRRVSEIAEITTN